MKTEGITWHATVVTADKFAAQRGFTIDVLGLTPLVDMDGFAMFAMPNGSMYEIYATGAVPPYGYNEGIAFGWRVDDIETASNELAAAGFELLGQINRIDDIKYAYRHFKAADGRVYGINEQK